MHDGRRSAPEPATDDRDKPNQGQPAKKYRAPKNEEQKQQNATRCQSIGQKHGSPKIRINGLSQWPRHYLTREIKDNAEQVQNIGHGQKSLGDRSTDANLEEQNTYSHN